MFDNLTLKEKCVYLSRFFKETKKRAGYSGALFNDAPLEGLRVHPAGIKNSLEFFNFSIAGDVCTIDELEEIYRVNAYSVILDTYKDDVNSSAFRKYMEANYDPAGIDSSFSINQLNYLINKSKSCDSFNDFKLWLYESLVEAS